MPSVSTRLILVRQCLDDLWQSRNDGRWATMERALIEVLAPQKAERRRGERRSNVILMSDYLERRRGERRRGKPP